MVHQYYTHLYFLSNRQSHQYKTCDQINKILKLDSCPYKGDLRPETWVSRCNLMLKLRGISRSTAILRNFDKLQTELYMEDTKCYANHMRITLDLFKEMVETLTPYLEKHITFMREQLEV